MGPILVNTKQKIAVLAVGLAVATTGFVTDEAAVADPSKPASATHGSVRSASAANGRGERETRRAATRKIGAEP
jgi:hypothetical protein